MKRRLMNPNDNSLNVIFNQSCGIYHTCMYECSAVDDFYIEVVTTADKQDTVFHVDPLIMLFNQERLENIGSMGAKQFLDSLSQKDESFKELRSKCTDDQLMDMLKSRYLQTPSEVMAYCRYIEGNIEQFYAELNAAVERQKDTLSSSSTANVEPTNNTE